MAHTITVGRHTLIPHLIDFVSGPFDTILRNLVERPANHTYCRVAHGADGIQTITDQYGDDPSAIIEAFVNRPGFVRAGAFIVNTDRVSGIHADTTKGTVELRFEGGSLLPLQREATVAFLAGYFTETDH